MNIRLTAGAGYIGSHTAVVLSQVGHEVVLLDNFAMGSYLGEDDIMRFEDAYGRAPVVKSLSNPIIASEAR